MSIKLRLVACDRYNFRGELYEKGKVYRVGDDKGKIMLRKKDEWQRPYFVKYEAVPEKSAVELAAEAAAAAAVAAAQLAADEGREEEVVDRPDGSEPDEAEPEVEFDPDTAVEVDTDDDPALDEDTKSSGEEVPDDVDRADGSEVEV